jgi:protein-disulfide isomerase
VLDVLTSIVLLVALYFLVRPGSELQRSVSRWRAERASRDILRSHWDDAVALAQPLYETADEPQVIEFLDYECPFCRRAAATVDSAIAAGVRIAVVQLPLDIHPFAKPAALAALCAAASDDFLVAHRTLIHGSSWQEHLAAAGTFGFADLGVESRVGKCITEEIAADVLRAHIALADTLRISATPRFVSRGGALNAPPTVASLIELANRE